MWITPQLRETYPLQSGQRLELKTTANLEGYGIIFHYPHAYYNNNGYNIYFAIGYYMWSTTWTYVVGQCTPGYWDQAIPMTGVPSDEIKVWQITRTSTSLVVVCNGVTVVNFIFATDYSDGHAWCPTPWTNGYSSIRFDWSGSSAMYGSGYLFMRIISDNGKLHTF